MKISIVIPAYHEEKTISKLLTQIKKSVTTSHEILIVYDYDKDPTVPTVKHFLIKTKQRNIFLIKNSKGNGKGVTNAIKTGFEKAKGNTVVAVMADLSDNLFDIDKMFKEIEEGYDIVCGSRYMKGGKKIGGPVLKTFLSKLAGLTLHYLFKLPTHDATNAFKMYRKTLLNEIPIQSTGGFEYSLEITLKAFKKGYKITEIPTLWYDRPAGKSNFKLFSWLPKYIKTYSLIFNFSFIEKFRKDASVKITLEKHLLFLTFSLILSVLIFFLIILSLNLTFKMPKTTAINWLTVFKYPKQQDYYFFYSFIVFNVVFPIFLWFVWVFLKIKNR